MQSELMQQVAGFAERHGMLRQGEHLLLAVSGGADSMALAHFFMELRDRWNLRLSVAHLDHDLRGAAGREDLEFVREWAAARGIPFFWAQRPVAERAREQGASIEEAARNARYDFLLETAAQLGAEAVATGHTRDDQAETVLLRLLRGAGSAGLAGIAPVSMRGTVRLLRPLLSVSRQEILAFLASRGQDFREDLSNRDPRFLRNRVRHEMLPVLESVFDPDVRERLVRVADLLGAENAWMETLTQEALQTIHGGDPAGPLDVAALAALPLAAKRRVVRAWVAATPGAPAPDFAATARILSLIGETAGSAAVPLSDGWRVVRSYGRLQVESVSGLGRSPGCLALEVPGETVWTDLGLRVKVTETFGCTIRGPRGIGRWPAEASLRRAGLAGHQPLLRLWRPGDRIAPSGMAGTRKVQDVFVDERVPRADRARIPLLCCGDEVVWLPGYSVSRAWMVQKEHEPSYTIRIEQGP